MKDTTYESKVTCPYCGYVESDSWEFEDGEYECGECGEEYAVEIIVMVYYSTYKAAPPDPMPTPEQIARQDAQNDAAYLEFLEDCQ